MVMECPSCGSTHIQPMEGLQKSVADVLGRGLTERGHLST